MMHVRYSTLQPLYCVSVSKLSWKTVSPRDAAFMAPHTPYSEHRVRFSKVKTDDVRKGNVLEQLKITLHVCIHSVCLYTDANIIQLLKGQ